MLLILGVQLFALHAEAKELYEAYRSVRGMAMGNAYTAVVDNEEALMYNPASLCRVSGIHLALINPAASAEGFDLESSIRDLTTAKTNTAIATALRQFYGKRADIAFSFTPIVAVPCIGVGLLGDFDLGVSLNNPAYPNLNLKVLADYGGQVGFGVPLIPKILYFGVSAKFLKRAGADVPIGISTIATLSDTQLRNQVANSGTGYGSDMGLTATLPGPIAPTLAFAWKNMGNTAFTQDAGLRAPNKLEQEMTTGASLTLDAYVLKVRPAIEFKHMNDETEQLGKKIHMGMELDLPIISLRGGFNQGYMTYGAGVDLGWVRVDAASYGVEMGVYPGQDESRRFAVQAVIDLSLDANFSFDWKFNTHRRGVKQRR